MGGVKQAQRSPGPVLKVPACQVMNCASPRPEPMIPFGIPVVPELNTTQSPGSTGDEGWSGRATTRRLFSVSMRADAPAFRRAASGYRVSQRVKLLPASGQTMSEMTVATVERLCLPPIAMSPSNAGARQLVVAHGRRVQPVKYSGGHQVPRRRWPSHRDSAFVACRGARRGSTEERTG